MTFEEQFPSLKHLELNKGLSDIEEVLVKDTLKHCLDKQRVKDAIDKFILGNTILDGLNEELLKELGLLDK